MRLKETSAGHKQRAASGCATWKRYLASFLFYGIVLSVQQRGGWTEQEKKTPAAILQEVAREVNQLLCRVFAQRRKDGRTDLQAVESALRTTLHQAGAAALTELLQFEAPAADQRQADCSATITGCPGRIDTTRMQGRNYVAEDGEFGRSRRLVCSLSHFGFLCSVDLVDGPPQPVDTVANRRSLSLLGAPNGTRDSSMKCSIRLQMGDRK